MMKKFKISRFFSTIFIQNVDYICGYDFYLRVKSGSSQHQPGLRTLMLCAVHFCRPCKLNFKSRPTGLLHERKHFRPFCSKLYQYQAKNCAHSKLTYLKRSVSGIRALAIFDSYQRAVLKLPIHRGKNTIIFLHFSEA